MKELRTLPMKQKVACSEIVGLRVSKDVKQKLLAMSKGGVDVSEWLRRLVEAGLRHLERDIQFGEV